LTARLPCVGLLVAERPALLGSAALGLTGPDRVPALGGDYPVRLVRARRRDGRSRWGTTDQSKSKKSTPHNVPAGFGGDLPTSGKVSPSSSVATGVRYMVVEGSKAPATTQMMARASIPSLMGVI
jgi:hypothetical protein